MEYTEEMTKAINSRLANVLNELNQEFGINLEVSSFRWSKNSFSIKVLSETDALKTKKMTEARQKELTNLLDYLYDNDVDTKYLHTPIGDIQIVGFRSRATVKPIRVKVGNEYGTCSADYIKEALRKVEKEKIKEQESNDNLNFL